MPQYDSVTTRARAAKSTAGKSTDGLPTPWKSYEPNTSAWIKQARKRYPRHAEKLDEIRELAQDNTFFCYECYRASHLADYYVRGDRTETFRYCVSCARGVRENGASITKLQDIADPEEELNPNETIEFAAIEESRSPARRNFHPLFYVGATVFSCVLLFVFIISGLPFISSEWNAAHNGSAPISELSINVAGKPYLAVAQNINGQVIVIIEPLDDITHLHEYPIAKTSEPGQVPQLSFDGLATLYVHVGDSIFPLNLASK